MTKNIKCPWKSGNNIAVFNLAYTVKHHQRSFRLWPLKSNRGLTLVIFTILLTVDVVQKVIIGYMQANK